MSGAWQPAFPGGGVPTGPGTERGTDDEAAGTTQAGQATTARPGPQVRLFVYGTLLSGQAKGDLLAAFPREPATVRGTLFRLAGGYPVLVPDPAGRAIRGELVTAWRGVLSVLDLTEDVRGGLFRRAAVSAQASGTSVRCLAYVLRPADVRRRRAVRLDTDDWRRIAPRGLHR